MGVSVTTTHEETEKFGVIVLSLVVKESAVRGDPIDVWQGKITTGPDQIKDHPKTVIRALINQYGKNTRTTFVYRKTRTEPVSFNRADRARFHPRTTEACREHSSKQCS